MTKTRQEQAFAASANNALPHCAEKNKAGLFGLDQRKNASLDRAIGYNRLSNPIPFSEVKSTALSVAKWTNRHFDSPAFSNFQAHRESQTKARRHGMQKHARLAAHFVRAKYSQKHISN